MERAGARRHWLIWAAVLPILIWALVRTLGLHGGFPLIPLLAYTPYVAAAALLVAGLAVALRNWAASALAGLATLLLFVALAPRAIGGGGEQLPPGAAELRVLSANVHHGTAEPAALLGLVDRLDVDVLNVQELTPSFSRRLAAAGIAERLPNAILTMQRGASGGGIYSSLPLERLAGPPTSNFRNPRAALSVGGHRFRLVDVHPYPPKPNHVGLWREGIGKLPDAEPAGPPWVLAGDFNATLDFPELNDLIASGYRDAAAVTGRGLEPTWPSGELFPPPVTIDHVLADRRLAILDYAVEDLPGSDHRAVFARVAIP